MGKNGFTKVRVTKDCQKLIFVHHPPSFAMPPVVVAFRAAFRRFAGMGWHSYLRVEVQ